MNGFERWLRAGFFRRPLACVYEVTYRCDNRCRFCYAPLSQDDVARELDVFEVVGSLIEQDLFHIAFSGGEPLIRPEVVEAARMARRKAVRTTLITNGTHIPTFKASDLKEAFNDIQVSLQGPTAADHDRITGVPGSFERALEGIRVLIAGRVTLNVNATLTTLNADLMTEMMDFVGSLGLRSFSVTRFCTPTGGDASRISLGREEFRRIVEKCLEYGRRIGVQFGGVLSGVPLCSLGPVFKSHSSLFRGCWCGRYYVDITPWGGVKACPPMKDEFGRFDDLTGAWRSDFIKQWQSDGFLPEGCRGCKLVPACRGGCRAAALNASGRMDAPDPLVGRRARDRRERSESAC